MVTAGLVGGVFTTFIASLDHTGLFSAEKAAFQLLDFAIATSFTGICDFKDPIGITQTDADAYSGITVDRRVSGVGASVSVTSDGRGAATRDIAYYGRITATSGAANNYGLWIDNEGMGGGQNIGLYVHNVLPEGPNNYVLYSVSPAQSSLAGKLGLNFLVPTHQLEVGGDTMLRGTLEVTGNITSTGTAHAFASKSIPGMAVIGSTATAITAASGGNPGGIRWDEDFLYIRTATAWKKVALTAV
jgi:hypothetical protein